MSRFDVSGRVVLVTGASSGLGQHFAHFLAAEGARVVVCARRKDLLDALVGDIHDRGGSAMAAQMDVTDSDSVVRAIGEIVAETGRIDVLINNAGVLVDGKLSQKHTEQVGEHAAERMSMHKQRVACRHVFAMLH